MSETEIVEQTKSGVTVTITSKRGNGTRDQDTVKAQAHYEDQHEWMENQEWLSGQVEAQMDMQRKQHQSDE